MRATLTAAAVLAALAGIDPAFAETTVIERDEPTVVVRERPADVIEHREVERAGPPGGCESKTVTRTDEDGNSTTIRRERCD